MTSQSKRITHEPAFILHHYDWSESSLILEAFTRHHGRVALVARGAKKPSSNFRPVLLPLQPLALNFGTEGEIRALKGAEWTGGHVTPNGDALLSGYYLNELLMRLLARDDPHPALFDAYAAAVSLLAAGRGDVSQAALRAFELLLLREIGMLPALDAQTFTLVVLDARAAYELRPESGLGEAGDEDALAVTGAQWARLQEALATDAEFDRLVRACAECTQALRPQLRTLLNYHCGVATLRTRQMLIDLQALQP